MRRYGLRDRDVALPRKSPGRAWFASPIRVLQTKVRGETIDRPTRFWFPGRHGLLPHWRSTAEGWPTRNQVYYSSAGYHPRNFSMAVLLGQDNYAALAEENRGFYAKLIVYGLAVTWPDTALEMRFVCHSDTVTRRCPLRSPPSSAMRRGSHIRRFLVLLRRGLRSPQPPARITDRVLSSDPRAARGGARWCAACPLSWTFSWDTARERHGRS